MSRISLVEAYDNRDVIGQLVRLRQDVKQLYDIVENIDPSGDLTNFVTKTGDETIDGVKTFIGKIVADCDIIQLGEGYETHAEQVYSKDDYIVMRDGAIAGLASGERSGFQVKLYNGVDDARLAVDNEGVARVGDVGDEQPLLTRSETADMTSGNILSWDGVNQKAITSGKSVSELLNDISAVEGDVNTLTSTVAGKVSGTGNIGSDSKPVKIVNGQAVAVSAELGKVNTANSFAVGPVTIAASGSATIGNIHVNEAGTYLVVARFSSSGYSSGGGFFAGINGQSQVTSPFISGLTPLANASRVVVMASAGNISLSVSQYSGSSLAFSCEGYVVRLV